MLKQLYPPSEQRGMTNLRTFALSLLCAAFAVANPVNWKGEVDVMGQKLAVVLVVQGADAATLAIPAQGLEATALKDVKITEESMAFVLMVPPMTDATKASFTLTIDQAAGTATGTMKQAGMDLPVSLKRLAEGESVASQRPQDASLDPSKYTSEEVTFINPNTKGTLAGTLTIPQDTFAREGRHAVAVLISGSGAQDRDGTILGHKPFRLLADTLSRAGVAVLRVDDPGAGKSDVALGNNATSLDYAGDVAAAVAYLRTRKDIDPARVGLVGHSEGGLIAPIVASQDPNIAFVALLAGPGVTGREVLIAQLEAILRSQQTPQEEIDRALLVQRESLTIAASDDPDAVRREKLSELAKRLRNEGSLSDQQAQALTGPALAQPWIRAFLRIDPREYVTKLTMPVLIANGSLDVQVVATQNVPELQRALQTAGNTDVTTIVASGLNHLFQPAKTGGVDEYAMIETTIDPAFLDQLTKWVVKQANRTK
jgi:uncharacterized protein